MSRRKWIIPGCLLLAVIVVGVVIVIAPAAAALRLAGFRSEGSTDDFLKEQASVSRPTIQWSAQSPSSAALTPTPGATRSVAGAGPAPVDVHSEDGPLDTVLVDVWFLSQPMTFHASEVFAERLERGRTEEGQVAYYIEFDQEGVNTYLDYWFGAAIAQEERVQNAWIDLVPGGAVVYADVNLEVGWQHVGAAFMLDASGRQFILAGVDIDGRLYSTPPGGSIAELTDRLEAQGNRALNSLVFLDPAGQLTVQQISISEDRAQILAY
jgi:hypothetical protein